MTEEKQSERPTPKRGKSIIIKKSRDEGYMVDKKEYYHIKQSKDDKKDRPTAKKSKKLPKPEAKLDQDELWLIATTITLFLIVLSGIIVMMITSEEARIGITVVLMFLILFVGVSYLIKKLLVKIPYFQ